MPKSGEGWCLLVCVALIVCTFATAQAGTKKVVYKRQEDGVWFPATFGTEFRIHVLFFINRQVSVSLENSGFQHTHVESKMKVVGPVE
jgi:hypothetical protein